MSFAEFCGWAYAIVWGIAYYPTILLNYKVRSAESISFDTLALNMLGYLSYSASVVLQLFSSTVRADFEAVYGNLPVLSGADLFYTLHGIFVLLVMLSQFLLGKELWGFKSRQKCQPNRVTRLIYTLFALFLGYNWFLREKPNQLMNFALNLAYVKIFISCIKYIPQVIHNYHRKSMYGSSKAQVGLDYMGTFFAISEFLLKNTDPLLVAINLNRGKIGLICVSMIFDTIFSSQFIAYSSENPRIKDKEVSEVV